MANGHDGPEHQIGQPGRAGRRVRCGVVLGVEGRAGTLDGQEPHAPITDNARVIALEATVGNPRREATAGQERDLGECRDREEDVLIAGSEVL